jgi:hypothetical protein
MKTDPSLAQLYEDLANHFARQGEFRQRDQCLVLAADAALTAGMPQEAERLRRRLLLTNPHHLLRPYGSMAEAMQSSDVRDYVSDLRTQWPPETLGKLLNQPPADAPVAPVPPTAPIARASAPKPAPPKRAAPPAEEPVEERVTPAAYALAMVMLGVGVALASGLAFIGLVLPFLE